MTRNPFVIPLAGLVLVAGVALHGPDAKVQRGKYLVEEVARCQECHTPKTDSGEFDKARCLKGAKLEAAPIAPIQSWHATSPELTATSALGRDGARTA